MKLESQCCSFEQAKRLQELGISSDNTFFRWQYTRFITRGQLDQTAHIVSKNYVPTSDKTKFLPAPTVAELGAMLPTYIAGEELGSLIIQHSVTTKKQKEWYCHYYGLTKNVIAPVYGWSMADAMANMLLYLLEWGEVTPVDCNSRLLNS